MATESQTLVFESEEAREAAIDALGESPDSEEQLDAIMSAPIQQKAEADNDNPAKPEGESISDKIIDEIAPEEQQVKPDVQKPENQQDEIFQIKRSELPENFDSPAKLLKSYSEAQATLERQKKFIKERLGGEDENLTAAMKRAEKAEAELAEIRKKVEVPAKQETKADNLPEIPQSNAGKIKELRQSIQTLSKDPIANEQEILDKRLELDDLWLAENERTSLMIERATKRAEAAEARAEKAENTATGYVSSQKKTEEQKKAEAALQNEYKDIDTFSNDADYPEFKMSKSAKDVENNYLQWGADVARLYYGARIDISTDDGRRKMFYALDNLKRGGPDIVEKCQIAGVQVKPTDDIQKYLDICDLLDYRDGYRENPTTGKKEVVKRFHAPSNQYIPDAFPSLKAAYENRKVQDGYYADKIRKAYLDGGKSISEAANRASNNAVEMGNSGGVSNADAGLKITAQQAADILDSIDEAEALRKKANGDSSDYNKLNEAFQILGIPVE